MHLTRVPARLRFVLPLLAVGAVCAGCSSSAPPSSQSKGAQHVPVTVPANCPIAKTGSPSAHVFIGIKATANAGLTEKQVSAALKIPNSTAMPCASGANYAPGPPVQVGIYFLPGATVADQNTSVATMQASGAFSAVTVVAKP
jgi:hypothetical protein